MLGVSQPRNAAGTMLQEQQHPSEMTEPNNYSELLDEYDVSPSQRSWTIKKSILGGRGLFAKERIERGSLIFENKALAIGPRTDAANEEFCTSCFKICDCYKCDKCMLLICSNECESSFHHSQVCDYIITTWTRKFNTELNLDKLGGALIFLHFLLLDERKKSLLNIFQRCSSTSNMNEFDILISNFDIPEEQIEFMLAVNSIIKINSFRIANSSDNTQVKLIPLRGVYPLSSFLNHSCVPNTRNIFKSYDTMAVYATKDIEIGDEIVTCYTGLLWSTPARCQLFKTKGFWCKCERCLDRNEMGTKLSALKCLDKDCVGVLLPVSPTDPRSDYDCDNCGTVIPVDRVCVVQSALGSLVGCLDLDDQFRLETLVLERLAKFVPYSSHIFVDLRLRLALRIGCTGLKLNGIPIIYY